MTCYKYNQNRQDNCIHYQHNALGQITKITYPNNTTREYQYNAYGKVTWFKDEAGKVTEYDYASPLHLMTEKRLPDGERLKFRYDNIHLQISEIENQKGERYHFSYTPTGQLSEEIGFDEVKTTYHYDLNGYLIEKHEYGNQHDEKPLITRYQRDSRGKLIVKELADGIKEHYSYNQNGLLTQILDGQSVLGWEYNEVGRLTSEHQSWATIRHRYDENTGLLNGSKLPDGQWLEYYHIHGQLRGMTLDGQSLIGLLYDNAGRECERRQGNGLVNRYQYDPLGQLIAHQRYHGYDISPQTSPTPIWQQQYHYNPNGQLAEITGHQPRRYRYDNTGELHTVTYPEVNPEQHHAEKVEQFDYDPTGNKISETQALAPSPFHANIAKGNRLTFFSDKHFDYDRFGNLIAEKRGKDHRLVTHYQYDCRHRLIKVIKPTGLIITYTYDAFNRRTSKTVDGKTTEFIWQGSRLIAETDNDKHWQSYLYELDSYRPLALVHGNAQQDNIKLYWYQNDHLGTPIALTGSLGDTLYECQYNAYGQIINETYHRDDIDSLPDNPLRFQGQYYDEETGLHYNLNRYYDPFTGRYITQDPIKLMGGTNLYQYCPNPVNWVDPLGFKGMPGQTERVPLLLEKKMENPWMSGTEIESIIVPEGGIYAEMALSPEQASGQWGLGSWATTEKITGVDFVRNNLAVTPQFKSIISHVQKIHIPEGVRIQVGTVGPQIYKGVIYPGGGSQLQILLTRDQINKLITSVGKPQAIN
jgi:RHS repeat-associated protein